MVRWPNRPAKTIAVDLGRKATKQTNKRKQNLLSWPYGFHRGLNLLVELIQGLTSPITRNSTFHQIRIM